MSGCLRAIKLLVWHRTDSAVAPTFPCSPRTWWWWPAADGSGDHGRFFRREKSRKSVRVIRNRCRNGSFYWAGPWVDGSQIAIHGAGCSTSTYPSELSPFFLFIGLFKIHPGSSLIGKTLSLSITWGVGFLALAMGGLQIMLDKGEENDWFGSNLIRLLGAMFVLGMIGLVWQELRAKNPVINLRLFRFKNFTICVLLMSVVGGILNAGTVLEPQFLQGLLGYTATNAGRALTIGGFSCSSLCLSLASPRVKLLPATWPPLDFSPSLERSTSLRTISIWG